MRKNILIIVFTILCTAPNVFAQSISVVGPNSGINSAIERQRRRVINEVVTAQNNSDTRNGVTSDSGSGSYYSVTRKVVKKMKITGFEDEYKQFLKQPNTGLVKLLKEIDCWAIFNAERKQYTLEKGVKSCPSYFIPGRAVYYSFRHDDYVASKRSDLGLKNDWLFSIGTLNQSLMVDLGDVNLDELNSQSEGIKFLFDFVPETKLELADKQRETILNGIKDKNYLYSNALQFKKNSVIGLRVVAYGSNKKTNSNENTILDLLSGDNRKDIIVAFKVIDKADDGSVILLWKQLQIKASPALIVE